MELLTDSQKETISNNQMFIQFMENKDEWAFYRGSLERLKILLSCFTETKYRNLVCSQLLWHFLQNMGSERCDDFLFYVLNNTNIEMRLFIWKSIEKESLFRHIDSFCKTYPSNILVSCMDTFKKKFDKYVDKVKDKPLLELNNHVKKRETHR